MQFLKRLFFGIGLFMQLSITHAQTSEKFKQQVVNNGGYSYTVVSNDPLGARVYTLANGLKVYLSVYKDSPRIQTYIAVRAGSKNDPASATGLAHYLEHILFKGTSKIGTVDWKQEKAEVSKIESLFEKYRSTKDDSLRKNIYHQIDSVSLVAAGYAVANEYDKLLSGIGAQGTNAYTFVEQTVYVNDIPSNQMEKWAAIEGERFREVVPRLFHTELEAVYEEKNRGIDSDQRKVWEATLASLFKKHPYGTQTTIGTVDHLKNPSITEIKKYFDTYYVPNNMAICMSGDLDPDKTIAAISKYFGDYKRKELPSFVIPKEDPLKSTSPELIYGPDAESISLAYRFSGNKTKESLMAELISMILSNGQAGLMDLNLNQKQLVLSSQCYPLRLNDYTAVMIGGKPREGQSLDQLKTLLLNQVQLLKQGKFEDWLLKAIINDYRVSKMRQYESNQARADAFVDAFISNRSWAEYISETDRMAAFTKSEIVKFANQNFNENYIEIRKLTGMDSTIQKVIKPKISAVALNREKQSSFYKDVNAMSFDKIKPVFINYESDINQFEIRDGIKVLYKQNTENDIFSLNFIVDIGRDHDPRYALAVEYLDYLGTSKFSNEQLKKEFYKIGCNYSFLASADAFTLTVSGLNENFTQAMVLFEQLIKDPMPDPSALKDMVEGILKVRADNKLSKDVILRQAMVSYAKYGSKSPFSNILSEKELKALSPEDLIKLVKEIVTYQQRILYYGPLTKENLVANIKKYHVVPAVLKEVPAQSRFKFLDQKDNQVYFVNYPMVQAEVVFLTKSVVFDKKMLPSLYLFNEYFGGSMGSLVFQELRESKALAYAVNSRYQSAMRKEDPNFVSSYIGTQADKLKDAVEGLQDLIENMPQSDNLFATAKESIIESLNTQRITKGSILSNYESAKKLGLDSDVRKEIYEGVIGMSFEDLRAFQQQYIKGQKKIMLVIGAKDKLDIKQLEKYGSVKELTLEEIFGY